MPKEKHICIVVPEDAHTRLYRQVPVDVLHAGAELLSRGYSVSVWDRRVRASAPQCHPDLLALITAPADRAQCYPLDLRPVKAAVDHCRDAFPDVPIMVYGPHANHLPEDTLRSTSADVVARGEPEVTVVKAVERPCSQEKIDLSRILPASAAASMPEKIYTLPQPAYDLVDLHEYYAEIVDDDGLLRQGRAGLILAVRGCPYQCSFCHLPFGKHRRRPSLSRVLGEVDAYKKKGIDNIFFLDYVFGIDPKFYSELCKELASRKIYWIGQTRPEVVLKSDVQQWYKAGCRAIWLGAESYNIASAGVSKPITTSQVETSIKMLTQAGIIPLLFIMIGLPGENQYSFDTLATWLATLPVFFIVNQLTLRPGTQLYDQLAPSLHEGQLPFTWLEVEEVNTRYRQQFGSALENLEAMLRRYPNYLGNQLASW